MSKAILEYSIPEEYEEFKTAMNGINYKCVIEDLDNWLREMIKYKNLEVVKIQEVRDKLHELRQDY